MAVIKIAKPSCEHEKETHCIHSSERNAFRSCRQRWYWAHVEHLSPYSPIKPLEFGTAIHKGMEVFFDPDTWGKLSIEDKLQRALVAFDAENDKQRERYLKQNFADDRYDDYVERKQLGAGMLTNYAREIHTKQDNWFKPVKTEISFHVPLYDEEGNNLRCWRENCQDHEPGAIVTLDGRIDVLVEDLVNGGYFILDWKTASELIKNDKHLYLDDQIGPYTAALTEILELDVKGFLYVQLLKNYPKIPKELKRRTKGCIYSTSKSQTTTYELAEQTYRLYDSEAYEDGKYDEYLEWLKDPENTPQFQKRFAIRQNRAHNINVLKNASLEATEMTRVNLPIYPSPGKFNCQSCAFYEPCLQKMNDEDYEYTLESNYEGLSV